MNRFFASLCSGLLLTFFGTHAFATEIDVDVCPANLFDVELDVNQVLLASLELRCSVVAQQWSEKSGLTFPKSVELELFKIPSSATMGCPRSAIVSIKYNLVIDPAIDKRGFQKFTCVPSLF